MDALFSATPEAARALVEDYDWGIVVAPLDLEYRDMIRVPGWAGTPVVLDVEDVGDGWVKILWDGFNAPGPFTMFRADERLVRI